MTRFLCPWLLLVMLAGCGSDDGGSTGSGSGGASGASGSSAAGTGGDSAGGSSAGGAAGGGSGACPDASGSWKVTQHCDSSLVGSPVTVMQQDCKLSFAPPFNGFSGTVGPGGEITLSGPQTCTGTLASGSIQMTCTPGSCQVTLAP